jgi:hypothetical protein
MDIFSSDAELAWHETRLGEWDNVVPSFYALLSAGVKDVNSDSGNPGGRHGRAQSPVSASRKTPGSGLDIVV